MATEFHFYEPRHGHGLPHNPFYAIMGPRLIGWIATRSQDGVDNIAPYSFFGAYSVEPPIIGFSSEGWKDTVENVKKTGEFTWSLVSRDLAEVMNQTSAPVAPEVDEFSMAGIQKGDCRIISAKRVENSPVSFECRLSDLIRLKSSASEALDRWLVLGEVVGVHIRSDLLINGAYQTAKAEPILRAGGKSEYFGISDEDRFEMMRPFQGRSRPTDT
ncbi:Flavin reductase like domain protein [Hydrogenophaga sp. T4]|nr:Flavin reductase like domain protein [Hydrogenophaga sp. T4]